jgi:hypothetical protein
LNARIGIGEVLLLLALAKGVQSREEQEKE